MSRALRVPGAFGAWEAGEISDMESDLFEKETMEPVATRTYVLCLTQPTNQGVKKGHQNDKQKGSPEC